MRRVLLLFGLLAVGPAVAQAQVERPAVLPMRERAAVQDRWLAERLDTVVPALMRRHGVDLWVVLGREYNEDPVLETMLPATWLSARRRTVLVFHDPGAGRPVERLAVARYDVGPFPRAWEPEDQPDQWARLAEIVAERDPQRIAVDRSPTFALADGLASTEYEALLGALPARYRDRVVSAEPLAVGWLETRTPAELAVYPTVVALARSILHEGLSTAAVTPGVTTTDDLAWWYRDRVRGLGLRSWFHPGVSVQRTSGAGRSGDFSGRPGETVIQPGDLVWVDFGIEYLGLHTDTQQMAYVLRPGETAPPAGLVAGLRAANRVQDLLTGQFAAGRTGNEVLAAALDGARAEGIDATIYTHPIGFHGHGAGPTIGLWDQQDGVPGGGDYPLHPSTAYSIELNAAVAVPEWGGQAVRFMLEEDAVFDGEAVRYLDGRQEALLLIPRPAR
ncbi:M24 family metallopeptidase [Rubrivirga litoralis]|uniref:M24 family metallopeptidase n=1 Tax=Rubrivirga litoralis TaxID=3075598 RepID=A0ABU3BPY2_9BACT|nr:M24 family metallopeptidase [Rubrivirga sp. F394]MDT0631350.1 M24 family metallopeptidase [Rubrivirga sp. F394]